MLTLEIVTCKLLLLKRPTISQFFQLLRFVCGIFISYSSINRDVKISFFDLEFKLLLLNFDCFYHKFRNGGFAFSSG